MTTIADTFTVDNPEKNNSSRSSNITEFEDVSLIKAFILVSENLAIGAGHNRDENFGKYALRKTIVSSLQIAKCDLPSPCEIESNSPTNNVSASKLPSFV